MTTNQEKNGRVGNKHEIRSRFHRSELQEVTCYALISILRHWKHERFLSEKDGISDAVLNDSQNEDSECVDRFRNQGVLMPQCTKTELKGCSTSNLKVQCQKLD